MTEKRRGRPLVGYKKDCSIHLRLTDRDLTRLDILASDMGYTRSELIRYLINTAYLER